MKYTDPYAKMYNADVNSGAYVSPETEKRAAEVALTVTDAFTYSEGQYKIMEGWC